MAQQHPKPDKPYDNPRIFWDVDHTKMDFHKRANFIIRRVFERGDVQDIRFCRRYYGDELVREALLSAPFLSKHTLHLASAVVDRPVEEFRCYTLRQLNQERLPY